MFLSYTQTEVQKVQGVQKVQIRSIRLIRGRKREEFIGKDEQAINHLHFHTFCIKMAAARQKNK